MPTSYNSFLKIDRARPSTIPGRDLFESSESDRARLVFSSPFRRLQQKAQVYSLEDNAAVRSRLSHSLEVAQIGRYISNLVLNLLSPTLKELGLQGNEGVFRNLVETACLMHDIGNPPFGHFGEMAIADWFKKIGKDCFQQALRNASVSQLQLFDMLYLDFAHFDGNCQGLRILSKLQWNVDEFGLNLTYSQLATYLKYVVPPPRINTTNHLSKKAGYFTSEEELVSKMRQCLGMQPDTRFPLTYIMEASDDIAYCISDIEDGIEKDLIREQEFFDWMSDDWEKQATTHKHLDDQISKIRQVIQQAKSEVQHSVPMKAFTNFRTQLTSLLAAYAAQRYVDDHRNILNGKAEPLLATSSPLTDALEALRTIAVKRLYNSAAASNNEMAGYHVIFGILDQYKQLLTCDRVSFEIICAGEKRRDVEGNWIVMQQRLFSRLPQKYRRMYGHAVELINNDDNAPVLEWFHRAHLVLDYIAGMTDNFALNTYQLLAGINVGKPE